ncbi:MAG: amidase [Xanthobacteraceae bacterium]
MAGPAPQQVAPSDYGAFVPDRICRRAPTGRGVLDGLTFAVKDLIDVEGCRTGGGNPVWLAQQKPTTRSAPAVARVLAAGATLIGKTVTDELAFSLEGRNGHYGCPVNPACPDRLCGGSSSGSVVAVAAKLADFALGTDTGGSVRVPANFVGVFGFRPSHGAIALDGVVPFAPSYDTVGWFARDANILAQVGEALLPRQDAPPITELKLARDAFALVDQDLASTLLALAESLPLVGDTNVFAGHEARAFEAYAVLQNAEVWQSLGTWISNNRPDFADDIAQRFAAAAAVTPDQVARYRPVRDAMRMLFEAQLAAGTAIVMPTTPCVALSKDAAGDVIADFYRRALTLTSLAGHCGMPQVAVPLGYWRGCPIGLSIVGRRGSDTALLAIAEALVARRTGLALA